MGELKSQKGESKSQKGESGIEELRRAASVSGWARESAYDGFTAEACLNMFRACWASGWDIFPDELTLAERRFAARHGKVSDACAKRLERDLGGGS